MFYLLRKADELDAETQTVAGWRVAAMFQFKRNAEVNRAGWTHTRIVEADGRAELREKLEAEVQA